MGNKNLKYVLNNSRERKEVGEKQGERERERPRMNVDSFEDRSSRRILIKH